MNAKPILRSSRALVIALAWLTFSPVPLIGAGQSPPESLNKAGELAGKRPNLVLVIADDVSATDIGCYGNADVRTPNLDRLAANGQKWTRAYLTATVCSPSRCSVITGRYPHNTGAPEIHTEIPKGQPLFPRELQKAGYWCAQAGKWHMGEYPKQAFDSLLQNRTQNGPSGCRQWVSLLRERPKDKPFFLWLASYDAHRPWQPDPQGKPHDPGSIALPEPLVDLPTTRADLASYYNEIQRLDRYIGDIVQELKAQDELDNTLILFISDNGRPFPRAKRWLTEEGMRTPWIVHWPDGLAGRDLVCHELVSAIDIGPTFLALAGAETPSAMQGRRFIPQLADENAKTCDYVFGERNWQVEYCHERGLRHGSWTYYQNAVPELAHFGYVDATHYEYPAYSDLWKQFRAGRTLTDVQKTIFLQPRPREQLFNLKEDPLEVRDLADDPKHQKTLEQLREVMDRWVKQTGDSVPDKSRRTPDRHNRITGERLFEGLHPGPGKYEIPGQAAVATEVNRPGPR